MSNLLFKQVLKTKCIAFNNNSFHSFGLIYHSNTSYCQGGQIWVTQIILDVNIKTLEVDRFYNYICFCYFISKN